MNTLNNNRSRTTFPLFPGWIFFAVSLIFLGINSDAVRSDEVILKNGNRMEGNVTDEGDRYKLEFETGSMMIDKTSVQAVIEKETPREQLESKRQKLMDQREVSLTAEDHYTLYRRAKELGLKDEAERQLKEVIALDPNHRKAREALGHEKYRGEWMTRAKAMKRKGYKQYNGKWYTKPVLRQVKAREQMKKKEKKILSFLRRVKNNRKKERRETELKKMIEWGKKNDVPNIKKIARAARTYYDRAWKRKVEVEMTSYNVLGQMRVAHGRMLQEPPRSVTMLAGTGTPSSTGGGGTGAPVTVPATIELPELEVMRYEGTFGVPAGQGR